MENNKGYKISQYACAVLLIVSSIALEGAMGSGTIAPCPLRTRGQARCDPGTGTV